jgi:hypothetical protein
MFDISRTVGLPDFSRSAAACTVPSATRGATGNGWAPSGSTDSSHAQSAGTMRVEMQPGRTFASTTASAASAGRLPALLTLRTQ